MKREWKHPFWETAAKDRITCRLNITHDDGSFTTAVSSVSKYDENGKLTKDYQEVLDQNPIPEIDKFTEERLERHKQRREAEIKKNKERQEAKRLEDLFNYKLQTFEIPEIKNSEDRKLKAKIRKSRNVIELNMYATMLMMKELNESESN